MIKVQLINSVGCSHCGQVLKTLNDIKSDYPKMEIEEIMMTTERGMKFVLKYGIMTSPGVVINGELAFTGGASEPQLRAKLDEYKKHD